MSAKRCGWCGQDPLYIDYHDREWGVPLHDDRRLFEMLILEGAQAGLSWLTVLKKRPHYRIVFDHFDAEKIARYDQRKIDSLLTDRGIIRNRLKIHAAVKNARVVLDIRDRFESLDRFLWRYVDGQPVQNEWTRLDQIPSHTAVSDALSKDLKQAGCSFVGSTICYAFMQAVGMVNDHLVDCFRYHQVRSLQNGPS
jgi:DNA-3-methyladenine glycosylase I